MAQGTQSFGALVSLMEGELRAASDVIAAGMQQQHASVIKLVRKHAEVLEGLGEIRFEIRLNRQGRATEIAMLNEQQAAILISLMRNSQAVIDFKVGLVKEFYRMRDALQQRDRSLWQEMQALIAKETQSQVKASFGSHLMLTRKQEIPVFRQQRDRLQAQIQPSLFPN